MKYYMGIDNGGTTTKAALYREDGFCAGVASTETAMLVPRAGFTERDMEEMWEANCTVIRDVIAQTGIDAADIAGIACCGHGKGLYLWGKDGKPARPGIISTDNRAWEYPLRWEKDGTAEKVFSKSCQHIMACQPVSLLAWLQDHEPECLEKTQWIFECKDYVRFRLTREAYGEITDYSGANFVNLKTRQYDPELLRLFGLEAWLDKLPPLRQSTDICGRITDETAAKTGLKAGTPVAGGMFDIDACLIAVNAADEEHICMIAGTWSINEYIRREPVLDGKVLMNSLFCLPEYYLIEESSATSAGNHEWFVKTLLPELKEQAKKDGTSVYKLTDQWVEDIPAGEFCPIFTPFLMASNVHPNAKASFIGLSNYHTRKHLMRSVFEGIAFSHRYHLDKLLATRSTPPASIRLAGGVARSAVWTQIFADLMGYPIETVDVKETGALGCAMAAAVAAGDYPDLSQAAQKMVTVNPAVYPNAENRSHLEQRYQLYCKILDALDPVWDDLQKLL